MPIKTQQTLPTKDVQRRALTLDVEVYQHLLDCPDLSDDQKAEMMEALWLLVISFVDLDFQILFENSCGKPPASASEPPDHSASVIDCFPSETPKSIAIAAQSAQPKQEAS